MTVAEFPDKPQITTANQTHQIRQGRSRFIAMAGAYSLGNFNDNFMKQAVSLLAVSHGQVPCSGHNYGLIGLKPARCKESAARTGFVNPLSRRDAADGRFKANPSSTP